MINYNNRTFKVHSNTEKGETSEETYFYYFQKEDRVWAAYQGGKIIQGHLLGIVNAEGQIEMTYHHINEDGKILTGRCKSTPEQKEGRLLLREEWEWTSGKDGRGVSYIEEV